MPGRVPPPKEVLAVQKGSEYFTSISEETVRKYEDAILDNLLNLLKSDEVLMHFHVRLVCECENVRKVIEVANEVDIWSLEEIVNNLVAATTPESIALHDSSFHRTLFTITENVEFFTWWRLQSPHLNTFLNKFWESMGHGTKHHQSLMDIHMRIFEAIKNRDEEAAVDAMQEHFAVLLFQLLGTTYNED